MFRKGTSVQKRNVNIVLNMGGLGDNVCRMPALIYLLKNYLHTKLHIWSPDYFIDFAAACLKPYKKQVVLKPFSLLEEDLIGELPGIEGKAGFHTSMKTHLVDHAFHYIADVMPEIKDKNYPRPSLHFVDTDSFKLPKEYVVLTTGFTAKCREMLPGVANGIIAYCNAKEIPIVTLGKKDTKTGSELQTDITGHFNDEIDWEGCINLVDKTSLLQACKIMGASKGVIGLDNGLMHVAGCTDVPIIGGFSTVDPKHRMPYRNSKLGDNFYTVVPDKSLNCRFCQSKMHFMLDHDFRNCYYKDYKCLEQMEAKKYIKELEKVL